MDLHFAFLGQGFLFKFWSLLELDLAVGCPQAGASAAAAPGPSASTPSPSAAPLHPARRTRASRSAAPGPGPRGAGEPGGAGHTIPSQPPLHPRHGGGGSGGLRRMNGPDLAGGAHCSGRGLEGAVRVHLLPHPATPLGALARQLSLLPPGGRGAGVGWEGRSRGRVGWGQEGEGWGAERAEAAGRPPCGRAGPCGVPGARVPPFRTPAAPHPVRQ